MAQSCPRRLFEIGPWEYKEDLDEWVTDRWLTDPEAVKVLHNHEDKQFSIRRSANADLWLWSWGPPRVCDFCGGIHPDDALKLMAEGWEIERTTKSYKRYLHPPGFRIKHQAIMASLQDPKREPFQGVPSVWDPVPPVKLYVQHFNDEQIKQFNIQIQSKPDR